MREAEAVRRLAFERDPVDLPGCAVDPIDRVRVVELARVALVAADRGGAVGRVGEPDAAVGVDDGVVRRIELLAVVGGGEDGRRAVVLVAHDLPVAVLAGDLAPLPVEGVAVAVAGRVAEDADVAILFEPAQLDIVRDVAPEEEAADPVPGRALQPEAAGPEPLDRGIPLDVLVELRGDRDNIRVRVVDRRRIRAIVAVLGHRRAGLDGQFPDLRPDDSWPARGVALVGPGNPGGECRRAGDDRDGFE